jgi:hypothetical protein
MTPVDRVCIAAVIAMTSALVPPSTAHAQSPEAEVLFRDGRNLIKRGKIAAGCDKLAASERLESSVGTLLNVGDCRERLGKLASAWAAFRKAEAMAKRNGGDDKRQAEAARRAAELEPRLSNLVIEVPTRVDGLIVRRDGEVVDEAAWNTPMPVDPGNYTIVAEAPGYVTWTATVPVALAARRQSITVPGLDRAPVAQAPVAQAPFAQAPVAQAPFAPPPPFAQPTAEPVRTIVVVPGTWSATRKVAVVMALLGAGAVGTGIYFGWHARLLQDRADRRCPSSVCSDPDGLRYNDQARTSATRANFLYIAGGATLAGAAVAWLVGAPDQTVVRPTAGEHRLGLSIAGSF